jgi:O-antigen ligase
MNTAIDNAENSNQRFTSYIHALIAALVFLSPLLYVDALHNPSALPRSALLGIFSSACLLVFISFLFKKEIHLHIPKASIFFLAFVIWALLSLGWSVHKPSSYIALMSLSGLFIVFLSATQLHGFYKLRNILLLSVVAASIAAAIGLLQNWGVNLFGLRYVLTMGSTFYFKTHATLYFDLIFPASLALLLTLEKTYAKLIISIMSGLILGYLLESHTRGAWLALASVVFILSIFFIIRSNARSLVFLRLKKNWVFVALIILIGIFIFSAPGKVEKRWHQKTKNGVVFDSSTDVRLVNYRNSLELIKKNPLTGVGYGAFWKGFREYMNHPELNPNSYEYNYMYRLHNDLYQIFVELGLVGGFIFLAFYYYSIKSGVTAIRGAISDNEKIICLGLIVALFASGIHSLVDFPLHKPSSAIQIFLWLGLLASYDKRKYIALNKISKSIKVLIAFFIIIFVSMTQVFYYKYLWGNHYFYKADVALSKGECGAAEKYIDKSQNNFSLYLPSHLKRVDIYIDCEKSDDKLFDVIDSELSWDNTNIHALLQRGDMYYKVGLYNRSLKDYSKAVAILPQRPLALMKVAIAKIALGDVQGGVNELQSLEQKFPDYTPVKSVLKQLNVVPKKSVPAGKG